MSGDLIAASLTGQAAEIERPRGALEWYLDQIRLVDRSTQKATQDGTTLVPDGGKRVLSTLEKANDE